MALRFLDGFDHYAVGDAGLKWNTASGSSMQTGRTGAGQCMRFNTSGSVGKTFSSSNGTWTIGFAIRYSNFPSTANARFLTFDSSGTNQINLHMTSTGKITVYRNSTLLGDTGSNVFVINNWYYIECKVVVGSSAGSVEVRVAGNQWCLLSGINTDNAGSGSVNSTTVGLVDSLASTNLDIDDFYAVDGSGSANNTFLGDVTVQAIYPSGAGDLTQWTPLSGANYTNVNETLLNKDTNYNSTGTAGNEDLYTFGALSGTIGSIVGLQKVITVRKDDAGSRTAASLVKSGGTVYEGSIVSVLDNYACLTEVLENDPATAAPWTTSGVGAAQFGIKLES